MICDMFTTTNGQISLHLEFLVVVICPSPHIPARAPHCRS